MSRSVFHLVVAMAVAAGYQSGPPPSHIFHTGKIVTVDPQFRTVEAMAIRDGRIVATGTNADIAKLAGSGTERVDLGGKTVLPGLIDSHVHAPSASMYEFEQPVPDMETIEDVLAYIRARAKTSEPGRMDHAVAGLHHAPSRAALSDARRARSARRRSIRSPSAPGPDASLNSTGAVDERHRREVPGARRAALPRRARRERASRRASCATAADYIRSGARRLLANRRRPTARGCASCWPTTTRSASPASSTPMPIRAASSCTARCSSRTR